MPARVFPEAIRFDAPWRPFQQQILDLFEAQRAEDRRFHVVAAPGSGKTLLGLEMVRRLDAPALVLCPTLHIRDQWIGAFTGHFLPADADPTAWTTTDIAAPRPLLVMTYQALHCACTGEAETEDTDEREQEDEDGTLRRYPPGRHGRAPARRRGAHRGRRRSAPPARAVVDDPHRRDRGTGARCSSSR